MGHIRRLEGACPNTSMVDSQFGQVIVIYRPAFIDLECDEFIPQGIFCLPVRSCFVKSVKRVAKTGENTINRDPLTAEEIQLENTEDERDLVSDGFATVRTRLTWIKRGYC